MKYKYKCDDCGTTFVGEKIENPDCPSCGNTKVTETLDNVCEWFRRTGNSYSTQCGAEGNVHPLEVGTYCTWCGRKVKGG